jgi:aminopeptidase N
MSTPAPAIEPTVATASTGPIDLAAYRAAMKPEFAAEIDRFGNAPQYQIDLTIAPDRASYSATQRVHYTNNESVPLKEVYFSLFANLDSYGGDVRVQSVRVNGQDVKPELEEAGSALRIDLAQPLQPGESLDVELAYTGAVPTSDVELGYNQFGLHDNVLALPNFYPQIPAYDDQGWNIERGPGYGDAVFSDTALYQVNITAPSEQVVATSGACDPAGGGATTTWRCVSGPMRDFMIAMSPDFEIKSNTVDGVKINSYYLKEDAKAGARALQITSDAVRSYSQRIGPYPFTELDLVETPTSAGGIEYPGLIVVAQSLYENESDFFEAATAHEAAHQWWYSLVGNDQIEDPWLDEAFTQFTTALYYLDTYGKSGLNGYVDSLEGRYDRVKDTAQDKRSDLPVADYSPREYGAIVYGKAALFFEALYEKMGDAKFDQFMQDYFKTYRYGVAYPKDLFTIAAKYVDQKTLDELVKKWIETP